MSIPYPINIPNYISFSSVNLIAKTKSEDKTKRIRNQLTKLKAKKKKMNTAHRHIDKEMEFIALKKWVRSKYGQDSLNEFFEMSK